MSFSWRYLVRPDGSFSRIGNLNGSLDGVSDEELARLSPADRDGEEQPARPCSRCGGDLLLHWHGPLMTGVWMELCPACDAHRPAARAFIRWYRDADRDPTALPQLFEDWETETMHAHGWARAPQLAPPDSPPPPSGLTPRGRG
ncbi:DUF6300 family protein [Streptomyces scabiei]|uniref:DUF6300 family protein n=1 Tax=Streptomyces scabiei TaxID=1930 RepID=UPI0029BAF57C|nr:DUF6300 family protein [Streptomyces scabiei]MDX2576654.1 DUF6300 family protein [Streptomyces scabiei]MDX3027664.1 DUF6300 family protein [Streptomyces scabiei]MDX3206331.1 DUF6300 family protein [Streptomyces scabiei]